VNFNDARAQFPVLDRVAYLNAGSMGPLARATVEAMTAQLLADLELGRGGHAYIETMMELRKRVRTGLAATIGVPAENVALTTSTTEGCNIVLSGLRLQPGDEIVTTDTEHFGLLGALDASEATVRVAAVRAQPPERALEAILAEVTPRTRLIALSHVSWQTGNLLPIEELQDAASRPMLVDGAQSAGAIAVDATRYDYYTISGQKWLCGPDATGGLYVRDPEALSVALPTAFSQESYDESGSFTPRPGAARFDSGWLGTPSLAGLEATETSARAWTLLANRFELVTAPGQANLVSFVAPGDPEEIARRLFEHGIVVRSMPGTPWLRISCGWWTSDEDLQRLIASL
jgi:L-cysteine/cystine lyase